MTRVEQAVWATLERVTGAGDGVLQRDGSLDLKDQLGLTSLHMVQLLVLLSSELSLNILQNPDMDISELRTVGDVIDVFSSRLD